MIRHKSRYILHRTARLLSLSYYFLILLFFLLPDPRLEYKLTIRETPIVLVLTEVLLLTTSEYDTLQVFSYSSRLLSINLFESARIKRRSP